MAVVTWAPPTKAMPSSDLARDRTRLGRASRHFGHIVERHLQHVEGAHAGPQGNQQTSDQHQCVALELARLGLQLLAHERNAVPCRVDDRLLQVRVALQHEAQHGGEHQEQREHGEEAEVRHERGVAPGAMVAEVLHCTHQQVGRCRTAPNAEHLGMSGPRRLRHCGSRLGRCRNGAVHPRISASGVPARSCPSITSTVASPRPAVPPLIQAGVGMRTTGRPPINLLTDSATGSLPAIT